ncbi:Hypothetical predicted protein [Mytilus galloprovincialis]|uniref:Uncharacterized protein n=1 Tax=Mytilus galloprovincialis TaxID=29158 RepID=A0A8B6F213_MYTGA|nr:Hypothetical predicted protein [Mytilus galloprovincialis]
MCNNYLRSHTNILNECVRIVYHPVDNVPDRKLDHKHSAIGTLEQYKDLFQACMYGDMKLPILRTLQFNVFFKPSDPYVSIWFEQTPLLLAIRRGHTEVSKFLLRHGVNVNLTFEEWEIKNDIPLSTTILYGYTPLFAACQRKDYKIVDMLLDKGANLNKALYDACREGYLDTVRFLLQKGADVNLVCRFGQTSLYAACIGGHSTIVKFLVDEGAFIDVKVIRASILDEPTCLHAAYQSDNQNIVQLLINRGASADTVGNLRRTLLHKACRDGNYNLVEILVGKGVDINASDMYGATPIIMCVLQNSQENAFVNHLIHVKHYDLFSTLYLNVPPLYRFDHLHSKYVHEWNKYIPSGPICKILTDNHYKVIQLLIENGADINKADKKDRTPLSLAKMIGDVKLIDILLQC